MIDTKKTHSSIHEKLATAKKDQSSAVSLIEKMIGLSIAAGKFRENSRIYITVSSAYAVFLFESGMITQETLITGLITAYREGVFDGSTDIDTLFEKANVTIFIMNSQGPDMLLRIPDREVVCQAWRGKIFFGTEAVPSQ